MSNPIHLVKSLVRIEGGDLTQFVPEEALPRELQIEATVELCKALKDWESLDIAVSEMIKHQSQVVAWWVANVPKPKEFGRGKLAPERGQVIARRDAEHLLGISNQKISKWHKRLKDREAYQEFIRGPSYRIAMAEALGTARGTAGTGEFERYTPAKYIDAAREVLGEIDLDPASSRVAQETVRASRFFTVDDDGLEQDWEGRVWLNPPYHRELLPHFVSKLVAEFRARHTQAAIMLTNNSTDTEWFIEAAVACAAICFTQGRVRFLTRNGEELFPTQGQAFFYFGDDPEAFSSVFCGIGTIMTVSAV
jgi:hypothetical protein